MYVLDSSILIEVLGQGPRAKQASEIVGEERCVTTSICMHEVLAGLFSERECFIVENILSTMQILVHDARAAKFGAVIAQDLTRTGTMINKFDILIAAICKAHDAELITLDKDFQKIKDLKVRVIE